MYLLKPWKIQSYLNGIQIARIAIRLFSLRFENNNTIPSAEITGRAIVGKPTRKECSCMDGVDELMIPALYCYANMKRKWRFDTSYKGHVHCILYADKSHYHIYLPEYV